MMAGCTHHVATADTAQQCRYLDPDLHMAVSCGVMCTCPNAHAIVLKDAALIALPHVVAANWS